jgi:hypothetical protein
MMQVLQRIIMRAQDPDRKSRTLSTTEVLFLTFYALEFST